MNKTIRFGYTPDPDDAYHYYGIENGLIADSTGDIFSFRHEHIQKLNEMTLLNLLDVSAISSIFYPYISDHYAVLASGSSVGRGYGPALCCREDSSIKSDLKGKTVAVPGLFTTGFFLLRYFYKDFTFVPMEFDKIIPAIHDGQVDAGVLIHEELMNYRFRGLRRIACLGEKWFEETGLPLPVGLNVARKDMGPQKINRIVRLLEQSMSYAMAHPAEAGAFASGFSCEAGEGVKEDFIGKFSNEDTLCMPQDVRRGLSELFDRAYDRGILSKRCRAEIIG